ncbi:bacteriocin biosynthesis protein SagD [Cohnella endophytica]|uniref:Bacteriocin biosynthesis protein SagD n=1 Tax=Cohnella endophytica TaxID=2419778 RepID=A0A494YDM3_9BACL|nr:TOMM precursor leader peptide-binding protein [Cohnella endophytica]RKP58115.1 bacteriocin biosynthesis protein SagD [Cohnella endophytica]
MNGLIAIIGEGLLAQYVGDLLSESYSVHRQNDIRLGVPESAQLALVLADEWRPSDYELAEQMLRKAGISWLRGFLLHDEGVVGPWVRQFKPGCSQCAELRGSLAGQDREISLELQMTLLLHGVVPHDPAISRFGILHTSHIIAAETRKIMSGNQVQTECGVYFVDLRTLNSSHHAFLPDPSCSYCGSLNIDNPDDARISLKPSLKLDRYTYRCKPLDELGKALAEQYIDDRVGLFNRITYDSLSPFADVYANLPTTMGNETSAGRTDSYTVSKQTALLEGLERYCGITPRGKKTVVHDCYRNLVDRALNPMEVGLYSQEQYELMDFPYQPFDPELPMNWVWGHSFGQDRPILIPEQLAYYSMGQEDSFVMEGSNGCALGGSLEEAIFYGIMEVVERDSFLLTWYARLSVPRLDPYSSNDIRLRLMLDRLKEVEGYEVYLFNTTMENGIPSVWAIAKNKTDKGANLLCAGGAHLDPIRAAISAIQEVAGNIRYFTRLLEENEEECRRMMDDPFLVKRMEDHSLLYSLPETEERLHFLLDQDRPIRTFAEEFIPIVPNADLTEELKEILLRFHRLNLDVIVVQQTAPEALSNGLHCVKVLIPGMLPMSFGHQLKRVAGLQRALTLPAKLGYSKSILATRQLNPHPHPFP